jgi:hypothetical protein
VRRPYRPPQATQELRDHDTLLGIRECAQCCTWLAPLQEYGTEIVVCCKEPHSWITIPKPQTIDLMLTFHMGHPEFQHCGRAIRECGGRNPGATYLLVVEWRPQLERPSPFKVTQDIGQSGKPRNTVRDVAAGNREPLGSLEHHTSILGRARLCVNRHELVATAVAASAVVAEPPIRHERAALLVDSTQGNDFATRETAVRLFGVCE